MSSVLKSVGSGHDGGMEPGKADPLGLLESCRHDPSTLSEEVAGLLVFPLCVPGLPAQPWVCPVLWADPSPTLCKADGPVPYCEDFGLWVDFHCRTASGGPGPSLFPLSSLPGSTSYVRVIPGQWRS